MLAQKFGFNQRLPTVLCGACRERMTLKSWKPVLITSSVYCATYECAECGAEQKRDFKDGRDEAPLAPR